MDEASVSEQENAYVPEMEVSSEQTEEEVVESAKDVENRNEEGKQEVQVFRSDEEAFEYIRNYEIATNNKFVKRKNRHTESDIRSLYQYRVCYNFTLYLGHNRIMLNDGMPTVRLGTEDRECQYGPDYKNYKYKDNHPERKRRSFVSSKKLGCTAQLRIRKVLKFPDYYLEESKRTKHVISRMINKLRANFCEDTKRYLLVYVHIDTNHNHEPCPVIRPPKYLSINRKVSQGCNRRADDLNEYVEKGLVLKRTASLKGKDLAYLAVQFKDAQEMPALIARPRKHQKLEDLDIHELMSLFHEITGQVPNEMFALASKQFTKDNLVLLLHLCIMFANAAVEKQTHRSVRLKGTDCEFTPTECYDENCGLMDSHMHCPLCSKTDSYTDVALLKAHFTKQHLNKALEFSGMKILRCFDTCRINTLNIHNKSFKAGHWHCFACSNAIGSRYDTLLHFKRHLNAFGSSFQVHITQDINPASPYNTTTYEIQNSMNGIEMNMAETNEIEDLHGLDMPNYTVESNLSPSKYVGGVSPNKRPYTETGLGAQGGHDNSVVYVQEDELGNVVSTYTAQQIPTAGQENVVISYADIPDVAQLKTKIRELEMKNRKLDRQNVLQKSYIDFLEKTNSDQKQEYSQEIEKLKAEISELRKEQGLDDSSQAPDSEGNNSNNSQGSPAGPSSQAVPRKCVYKKTATVPEKASVDKPETVEDQLSDLKKEMQNLRSNLYANMAANTNMGTNPLVPNAASLCYIPNNRIMTPFIFPQNMTGLANTNLATAQNVPVFQNTAALNLLNTQQKLSRTLPIVTLNPSAALPKTPNTDASKRNDKQSDLAQEARETIGKGQSDIESSGNNSLNKREDSDTSNTAVPDEETINFESPDVSMDTSCAHSENDEDTDTSTLVPQEKPTADDSKIVPDKTLLTNPKQKLDGTCDDSYEITMKDAPESETMIEDESESLVTNSDEIAFEMCQISPGNSNLFNKTTESEEIYHATPLSSYEATVSNNVVTYTLKSLPTVKTNTVRSTSTVSSSSTEMCTSSLSETVNANTTQTSTTDNLTSNSVKQSILSSTEGMQSTAPKPVIMLPNQFMASPNIQGSFNPLGMAAPNIAMNLNLANNLQKQNDQYVVVHSPYGSFLVPKSKISGLDKIPGMNTSDAANSAPSSEQRKESTAKVQNTETTNTAKTKTGIVANTKGLANRKGGVRQGNAGSSNIVFVEHGKNVGKLGVEIQSSSSEVNDKETPNSKCSTSADSVNIQKSKGVYRSTPMPQKSVDSKSATKRVHEESPGNAVKTNRSSQFIKNIISVQPLSDDGDSDTVEASPAKKKSVVLVKVNKNVSKSALTEFLMKNKVFLKKVDKSKKNE